MQFIIRMHRSDPETGKMPHEAMFFVWSLKMEGAKKCVCVRACEQACLHAGVAAIDVSEIGW